MKYVGYMIPAMLFGSFTLLATIQDKPIPPFVVFTILSIIIGTIAFCIREG